MSRTEEVGDDKKVNSQLTLTAPKYGSYSTNVECQRQSLSDHRAGSSDTPELWDL